MRFRIEATSIWSNATAHEKLIKEYPCLQNFGYEVETTTKIKKTWINDECGNRIWQKGPETIVHTPYVNLNSLEDLNRLYEAVANPLIYSGDISDYPTIEIYDGFRE